jgi:hypothetical protein
MYHHARTGCVQPACLPVSVPIHIVLPDCLSTEGADDAAVCQQHT